LEPLRKLLTRI